MNPKLIELERIVSLFQDDDVYLQAAILHPKDPPLPLRQVLASIKTRAKACLDLIGDLEGS